MVGINASLFKHALGCLIEIDDMLAAVIVLLQRFAAEETDTFGPRAEQVDFVEEMLVALGAGLFVTWNWCSSSARVVCG